MITRGRLFFVNMIFITILTGLLFMATCGTARADNQVSIIITDPKGGEEVPMGKVVRGTVSDATLQVYVLVHPLATNLWWVQRLPNVQSNGKWQSYCYFGTTERGVGEEFEIIAVASSDKNLYTEGQTLSDIPEGLPRSGIITVRRSQ